MLELSGLSSALKHHPLILNSSLKCILVLYNRIKSTKSLHWSGVNHARHKTHSRNLACYCNCSNLKCGLVGFKVATRKTRNISKCWSSGTPTPTSPDPLAYAIEITPIHSTLTHVSLCFNSLQINKSEQYPIYQPGLHRSHGEAECRAYLVSWKVIPSVNLWRFSDSPSHHRSCTRMQVPVGHVPLLPQNPWTGLLL